MSDLIYKESALNILDDFENDIENCVPNAYRMARQRMMELHPRNANSGEWIDKGGTWYCSECGTEDAYACDERNGKVYDFFCPHCGARMKGADDE